MSLLLQQLLLIAGCLFSMSGLYFSLRQRNVLILLTTNPLFFPTSFFFSFSHPPPLLFSNLYCLMDSTFLRMLAVPSKTDFCKVSTLYDIPNFFKLHRIFTISFSMTESTLCSYHLSHTFTPYFLPKAQWMFKHTLSCLLLYSFCAKILQPLTVCRTFSTCVPHNLYLFETSL